MKKLKYSIVAIILAVAAIQCANWVYAMSEVGGFNQGFENVTKIQETSKIKKFADAPTFVMAVLKNAMIIVPIIALVILIAAGVYYIAALGDEKKTERAKLIILYTVIGLIVIGLAGLVANAVINTFYGT